MIWKSFDHNCPHWYFRWNRLKRCITRSINHWWWTWIRFDRFIKKFTKYISRWFFCRWTKNRYLKLCRLYYFVEKNLTISDLCLSNRNCRSASSFKRLISFSTTRFSLKFFLFLHNNIDEYICIRKRNIYFKAFNRGSTNSDTILISIDWCFKLEIKIRKKMINK